MVTSNFNDDLTENEPACLDTPGELDKTTILFIFTFYVSVQVSSECRSIVTVRTFVWASSRVNCTHVGTHAGLQNHLKL